MDACFVLKNKAGSKMTENFPYSLLNRNQLISEMNRLASDGQSFVFIIDYKAENGYLILKQDIDNQHIKLSFTEKFETKKIDNPKSLSWKTNAITKIEYQQKFDYVRNQIQQGNSFLVNLTQPTPIETNYSLEDIYDHSEAKYKLWLRDQFVVLSPETFVKITNGKIASFPMKGTIDATLPYAEQLILSDVKERAEHATIVDLIRNDLSIVANKVEVKRYRFIDRIITNKGELLQVSSEITGELPSDYCKNLGSILFSLLPAGSISGAPKPKTLEIIEAAEGYERGFYTGIFGYFDGQNLDSAVMIRFIEQQDNKLIFKSGGGITSQSNAQNEYEELIQKVYVPIY
jgi:para-aminobenzoate synthetase component I